MQAAGTRVHEKVYGVPDQPRHLLRRLPPGRFLVRRGCRVTAGGQGTAEACGFGWAVWCPWNRMDAIWVSSLVP